MNAPLKRTDGRYYAGPSEHNGTIQLPPDHFLRAMVTCWNDDGTANILVSDLVGYQFSVLSVEVVNAIDGDVDDGVPFFIQD